MATIADLRRLASALPGAVEGGDGSFRVSGKLFAWPWLERVAPGCPRVANPDVLVVRVADDSEKFSLIQLDPSVFFTEPHYDGYAAILIRLAAIDLDLLERLITDSWRSRASRTLLEQFDAAE